MGDSFDVLCIDSCFPCLGACSSVSGLGLFASMFWACFGVLAIKVWLLVNIVVLICLCLVI